MKIIEITENKEDSNPKSYTVWIESKKIIKRDDLIDTKNILDNDLDSTLKGLPIPLYICKSFLLRNSIYKTKVYVMHGNPDVWENFSINYKKLKNTRCIKSGECIEEKLYFI